LNDSVRLSPGLLAQAGEIKSLRARSGEMMIPIDELERFAPDGGIATLALDALVFTRKSVTR
jgi:hypothetical protein